MEPADEKPKTAPNFAPMARSVKAVEPPSTKPIDPIDVWLVTAGVIVDRIHHFHGVAPEESQVLDCGIYSESAVGAPPVWPRAWRDGLLAATDKWDLAAVRAARTDVVNTARDAYRSALRNLPAACPDPLAVVWPTKPE